MKHNFIIQRLPGEKPAEINKFRSYCCKCKKKKMRKYMIQVRISKNNRFKWRCVNCKDENRSFGRAVNDYSTLTKNNVPLDKYKKLLKKVKT